MAASRAKTIRSLSRSRARRRILPTAIVTSVAIIGAGVANAFVNSTIVPSTTTTTSPAAANSQRQSAANARTLAQVSAALAADRRTLAALLQSAASARALAVASASGSPSPGSSSSAGVVSVPSAASPVIAAPAPIVHATTGASGAG